MMKPFHCELHFDVPFPPERVWPILADTDRINRRVGLPPTRKRVLSSEAVTSVRVNARMLGIRLEWDEEPFEFVENRYYNVRRKMKRGPVLEFNGGARFERTETGTHVHVHAEFLPANHLGQLFLGMQWKKTKRDWIALVASASAKLAGEEPFAFGAGVDRATSSVENATRNRLHSMAGRLADDPMASLLFNHLATAPDYALNRIRPRVLSREWGVDAYGVLRLCLHAVRAGVLDLSWDLICPNCQGASQRWSSLGEVEVRAHCDTCQINFDANFDRAVEVTFRPSARIRVVQEVTYCSAGPLNTPHIVAQTVLSPGEERVLETGLSSGRYRLRNLTADRVHWLYVDEGTEASSSSVEFGGEEIRVTREVLRPGEISLRVVNGSRQRVQFILERFESYEDRMSAAVVTVYQEFRDLFSSEVLSQDTSLAVRALPLLFTDLKGSTALYRALGDASAYALVRDHFEVLKARLAHHGGGLIKTIGDAIMAAFPTADAAVLCALEFHADIAEFNLTARQPLVLKIGLHQGPSLAVRSFDGHLDYFGTTVNLAARAHAEGMGGDIVITRALHEDPSLGGLLDGLTVEPFQAPLRGIGFVDLYRIWPRGSDAMNTAGCSTDLRQRAAAESGS
ncbi:MAG: hypothetical protein NVSMB3_10980 [Acidobacteriaceae bacterium]